MYYGETLNSIMPQVTDEVVEKSSEEPSESQPAKPRGRASNDPREKRRQQKRDAESATES